jgi:hypothetical protein
VFLFACGDGEEQQANQQSGNTAGIVTRGDEEQQANQRSIGNTAGTVTPRTVVPLQGSSESCSPISAVNRSSNGVDFEFYRLAEDPTHFEISRDQTVYVVGDIHGSWEVMARGLIHSGVMELASPPRKQVSVSMSDPVQGEAAVQVEIPNLQFRPGAGTANKIIFVGDYIGKCTDVRAQKTLALLKDVLEQQQRLHLAEPVIVAILGNHDFEAVNGIVHSGYLAEKMFYPQVRSMIQSHLLLASHVDHGIWYSHSFLTPHDVVEMHNRGMSFYHQPQRTEMPMLSQGLNDFVDQLILAGSVARTWLRNDSLSEGAGLNANFLYAADARAAYGGSGSGSYEVFPMIIGHLSDRRYKTIRVLGEGPHTRFYPQFAHRSHILCVDTAIYDSTSTGTNATYLKINYHAQGQAVVFESCDVPTR